MNTRCVPRRCWKKLWKYCLKHSETGTITVSVLSSNRDGYYLLRKENRKRIGRSMPILHYYHQEPRPSIQWEYVY
jgi:hypothetical protein